MFKSQKGENKPIDRSTAYSILKDAAKVFGFNQIGTHTLRKTFGYHLYNQREKDIVMIMKALNHSDQMVTLRYIGIEGEKISKAVKSLKF